MEKPTDKDGKARQFSQAALVWIRKRGISKTARDVKMIPRSVQKWIQAGAGAIEPRPSKVRALIALANSEGVVLAFEDFYGTTTTTKPAAKAAQESK